MENPFSALLHLFFPERCAACGGPLPEGARLICPHCRWDMPLTGYARSHDNPVFKKFGGLLPIAEASSLFFFTRSSRYREMIHAFKYRGQWRISQQLGVTVIIVTHDPSIARAVDRTVAIRDGRTSSEILRKHSLAEELAGISSLGQEEETHEEFAVLDRAGRLQLPKEYLEELGLNGKGKIRVEMEEDKIILTKPEEEEDSEEETSAAQIAENSEKE